MLGRPSSYTEEKADRVCERLTQGESLLSMCRDDDMPAVRTVFQWLEKNEDFARKYARAREIQGHVSAEMAIEAAINAEDPQLGRLAYDARKWHASKLAPKVYGDKTEVAMAITGADNGPVQVVNMDPIEAARAYQKMVQEDK